MSVVGQNFITAFGLPNPSAPNGLTFKPWAQRGWERLHGEIGAGWYMDGFLYLFGEGLEALQPCLSAWSFLLSECGDRRIIGRNAYGAILILENGDEPGEERVYVLDPFTVTYDGDSNWHLFNVVGRALPERYMPMFLDSRAYDEWRKANGVDRLDLDDVLGIKIPKALGGELEVDNLQLDGIVDYYQTTGPIYAKAFASLSPMKNG